MTKGQSGLVYILVNPYMPNLVKIGRTGRTAEERAAEISRATGVPAEFEVIYDELVSDAAAVEGALHSQFSNYRVNSLREFFHVRPKEAIKALQGLAGIYSASPELDATEIEMLPSLEHRMRRWIKREIVSVKLIQYPDLCLLEITEQPNPRLPDTITKRVGMDCVADDDDIDNLMFDPERCSAKENAELFVNLDVYSMLMVGFDIISEDSGNYIAEIVEKYKMEPPHHPMERPRER